MSDAALYALLKQGAADPWGRVGRSEPGRGTGRVGRDRGRLTVGDQRAEAVAGVVRCGSPSETQRFWSVCDCRLTKR